MLLPLLLGQGAAGPVTHATTGALTGPGSAIVGSASSKTVRASSGVLTGQGSVIVGSASSKTTRPSTGVLTGQGSTVVGSASRKRAMATSGVLTGQGAVVAGSADRQGPVFVTHDTEGVLVGEGSVVVGSADSGTIRAASGVLVGSGSVVEGSATRIRVFDTSGDLVGQGATVVGTAERIGEPVTHNTSGDLVGNGSIISGTSANKIIPNTTGGPGRGSSRTHRQTVVVEYDGKEYRVPIENLGSFLDARKESVKLAPVKIYKKKHGKRISVENSSPVVKLVSVPKEYVAECRKQIDRTNEILEHIWRGLIQRGLNLIADEEDALLFLILED